MSVKSIETWILLLVFFLLSLESTLLLFLVPINVLALLSFLGPGIGSLTNVWRFLVI